MHSHALIHFFSFSSFFWPRSSRLSGRPSVSWVFSFSLSFSGWCAGACVLRPVICFGLLCLSLCVGCCLVCVRSLWCFCGAAGSCWPLVVVVFSSSVALLVFAFVGWGCFGLARSLLRSPSVLPAPSVGPLVPFGPVSVLLVPPSGYLWKFATLWEHPLGKGEATCHSSPWYMVLCTEDVWKATTRVPCSHMTRMVENTLLVAEGICTTIFY